jgi:subtilisin family serine protease
MYSSQYDGSGVDVYVVDTGIDTTHIEFQHDSNRPSRIVQNIYNAYIANKLRPSANTDGIGHGTHVSGIFILI